MDDDASYSDDALNIRHAFFEAKTIVYVEGDDDVLFWQEIFSQVADDAFEIESVGGAPALDAYISKIDAGQLRAIAARDADFLPILGNCKKNPKIIYTFGYSIENSLYVSDSIAQLVRAWCKSPLVTVSDCGNWLEEFAATVKPLVHLDAANAISFAGLPTIGDNCSRYMMDNNSPNACPKKVNLAASSIFAKIDPSALASASATIGTLPSDVLIHMRGHFLASAVHQYITKQAKNYGRKVSISAESLYAAAIMHFSGALSLTHPHKNHYISSAISAWKAI
ncbi:DUF4435 domain-containing protein [Acidovorax sp. LjRoot118]|uniref:DUF4435 domain-containing protein n=1 Tax=Acidovorax sp. LjRoot118 TaxID=3342256 RepID=UPI003ED0F0B3